MKAINKKKTCGNFVCVTHLSHIHIARRAVGIWSIWIFRIHHALSLFMVCVSASPCFSLRISLLTKFKKSLSLTNLLKMLKINLWSFLWRDTFFSLRNEVIRTYEIHAYNYDFEFKLKWIWLTDNMGSVSWVSSSGPIFFERTDNTKTH